MCIDNLRMKTISFATETANAEHERWLDKNHGKPNKWQSVSIGAQTYTTEKRKLSHHRIYTLTFILFPLLPFFFKKIISGSQLFHSNISKVLFAFKPPNINMKTWRKGHRLKLIANRKKILGIYKFDWNIVYIFSLTITFIHTYRGSCYRTTLRKR